MRPGGSDVVVVRDDNGGSGGWTALADPGDGLAGRRVVTGVTVPPVGTLLGSVRVSSRIAIAVDPRNRRRIYLAWCDGMPAVAPGFRLHLRRSDDGGTTWTGDLRTINQVTNPGLAVNVRGTVGLLYQRLVTPAGGNRFETHLEISDDRFATVRADMLIAKPPPDLGGTFQPTIGDYANLVAVGKDFHGAFCGFNQPVAANFPNGITYLRNADFPNQRLLGNDGVTVRASSIDPFYVFFSDVAPADDASCATGPTARRASTPASSHRSARVLGGARCLEPARHGARHVHQRSTAERAGRKRHRQRRRQLGVRAHPPARGQPGRYVGDRHGTLPRLATRDRQQLPGRELSRPRRLVPGPDPTVTFAPADAGPITTTPFHWHLNPVASSHLCLAVELSSPGDRFAGQSLRGRGARAGLDQDLEILDDNNKAQRNMGLSTTPRGASRPAQTCICALVHNAATFRRDLELAYALDPVLQKRVETVTLDGLGCAGRRRSRRGGWS